MKYIFVLFLLAASLLSASQGKTYKFRAFQIRALKGSQVIMDWRSVNNLVVITMGDNEMVKKVQVIDTNPSENEEFDITSYKEQKEENGASIRSYGAVDKYLSPCGVTIMLYDPNQLDAMGRVNKEHTANLFVKDYSGVVIYRLKIEP